MLQSSPRKKAFSQREEKLPVALYIVCKRHPPSSSYSIQRLDTRYYLWEGLHDGCVCFTFYHAGTAPLLNKRVNMGVPQLLSREEKYPKVKKTVLQRT